MFTKFCVKYQIFTKVQKEYASPNTEILTFLLIDTKTRRFSKLLLIVHTTQLGPNSHINICRFRLNQVFCTILFEATYSEVLDSSEDRKFKNTAVQCAFKKNFSNHLSFRKIVDNLSFYQFSLLLRQGKGSLSYLLVTSCAQLANQYLKVQTQSCISWEKGEQ